MGSGKGNSPGMRRSIKSQMRFCAICGGYFHPRKSSQDLCFRCMNQEKRRVKQNK